MNNTTKSSKEKKTSKKEKNYSYYEFLREFYPNSKSKDEMVSREPKTFGSLLAEEAIKKVREKLRAA